MKRIIPFLALLLVIGWACQQEPEDVFTDQGTTTDSTLLRKYAILDPTKPSGLDTADVILFFYDNQKRIKHREYIDNYLGSQFKIITDYFYHNDTDVWPYKTADKAVEAGIVYLDTLFYTYANGVVVKDSLVSYADNKLRHITIATYTVSGNNVLVHESEKIYHNNVMVQTNESDETIGVKVQNGNIVEQVGNGDLSGLDYQALTYNDKPEPLYKTDVPYPVLGIMYYDCTKYLVTEQILGPDSATPQRHYRYTYTYRSDGYPLTFAGEDLLNPGGESKAVYIYY